MIGPWHNRLCNIKAHLIDQLNNRSTIIFIITVDVELSIICRGLHTLPVNVNAQSQKTSN